MKISQIVKEKRKHLGLTQENIAVFLFWLCCLADVFSPMRSIFSNLIFLIQNLWMLAGILIAHLRHGFNLPDKNTYNPQVLYSLPFDGEWFVVNGGTDRETSHSWFLPSQRYAYDFFIRNNEDVTFVGEREQLENYFCYAKNVLAPADGIVISVVNHFPNMPIYNASATVNKKSDSKRKSQ